MKRTTHRYITALIGTAALMPVVATLVTTILYLVPFNPAWVVGFGPGIGTEELFPIAGGAVFTLAFWLLVAIFFLPYTTVSGADPYSFNLLSDRLRQLEIWLSSLRSMNIFVNEVNAASIVNAVYWSELDIYIDTVKANFQIEGRDWTSAFGYLNLSRLLHRAEEALIMVEPVEALVADGSRIEVAIRNSAIDNKEYYLRMLKKALDYLSPNRFQQFQGSVDEENKSAESASSAVSSETGIVGVPSDSRQNSDVRATIREVCYIFNGFQDDQWEKLVHVRNQLLWLIVLLGSILYTLLMLMIAFKVTPVVLGSAMFFFLIGAGVGLLSRLYKQTRADSSLDNTHLAGVRLMAAPLISGLAALGGIALMQRVASPSGDGSFSFTLFNILISAAFGLAPNLFFSAIEQQVDAIAKGKKP
jgi:hypothetical protein